MKKKIWLIPLAMLLASSLAVVGCPPPPVPPEIAELEKELAAERARVAELEEKIAGMVPAPEVFHWRVQSLEPAGSLAYEVFVRFTERVRELSDGRLRIEPFPAGAIVGTFEKFTAAMDGVFEGFHSLPAYWTGKEPAFATVKGIPMGFPESWQFDAWFWEKGGIDLVREVYAKFDLFFVGPQHYNKEPMHFRVPVTTLADLEGLKFRSPAGMVADLMAEIGATVVVLPGPEIYTALDKGIIDGTEFGPLNLNYDWGFHEVARYFMFPGFHQPTAVTEFTVRMDVWEALPDDLRGIVETAVRDFGADYWYAMAIDDLTAKESMIALGNVLLDPLPEADIAKAREKAEEVWEKWKAKSPLAAEIIESQMEFMRLLGIID